MVLVSPRLLEVGLWLSLLAVDLAVVVEQVVVVQVVEPDVLLC